MDPSWLSAGWVSRLPRRAIQLFMGVALLTAAVSMLRSAFAKRAPVLVNQPVA